MNIEASKFFISCQWHCSLNNIIDVKEECNNQSEEDGQEESACVHDVVGPENCQESPVQF